MDSAATNTSALCIFFTFTSRLKCLIDCHEYFHLYSFSHVGQMSFAVEMMRTSQSLRLSLPMKNVFRIIDFSEMTSAVYRGPKSTNQPIKQYLLFSNVI